MWQVDEVDLLPRPPKHSATAGMVAVLLAAIGGDATHHSHRTGARAVVATPFARFDLLHA